MSDQIKVGLIIAAAILIATGGYIYFSPFQTCARNYRSEMAANDQTVEESLITRACLAQMAR